MISEFQPYFKSVSKSLDIFYVLRDIKPVSRIMVYEDEYEKVHSFIKKLGLGAALQGFKLEKTEHNRAFSNKGIKLDIDDPRKGHYLVYVSKDDKKAEMAKTAEYKNSHVQLGKILGYPECCCRFFEKYAEEQAKKSNDFVLPALKESEGFRFPFWNNVAVRHLDITLLSHFPCSFSCKKSIELAKKHFSVLENESDELATMFAAILKGAVLYTESQGIFVFHKPRLEENMLYFSAIFSTSNNELYNELKSSEFIEILEKNHIKLKNKELKGEDYGMMVFE